MDNRCIGCVIILWMDGLAGWSEWSGFSYFHMLSRPGKYDGHPPPRRRRRRLFLATMTSGWSTMAERESHGSGSE